MNIALHIPHWVLWTGGVIGLLIVGAAIGLVLLEILFRAGLGGPRLW